MRSLTTKAYSLYRQGLYSESALVYQELFNITGSKAALYMIRRCEIGQNKLENKLNRLKCLAFQLKASLRHITTGAEDQISQIYLSDLALRSFPEFKYQNNIDTTMRDSTLFWHGYIYSNLVLLEMASPWPEYETLLASRFDLSSYNRDWFLRPRYAFLATYPQRASVLRATVNNALSCFDMIFICLNGYEDVPDWIRSDRIIPFIPSKDLADNGKFLSPEDMGSFHPNTDYYRFTIDDDIFYPADYAIELSKVCNKYANKCVCGYHGAILRNNIDSYYGSRFIYHYSRALETSLPVDILGTGTTCYLNSSLVLNASFFRSSRMADLWFALHCHTFQIGMVAVSREAHYLRDTDSETTTPNSIYACDRDDARRKETHLILASLVSKARRQNRHQLRLMDQVLADSNLNNKEVSAIDELLLYAHRLILAGVRVCPNQLAVFAWHYILQKRAPKKEQITAIDTICQYCLDKRQVTNISLLCIQAALLMSPLRDALPKIASSLTLHDNGLSAGQELLLQCLERSMSSSLPLLHSSSSRARDADSTIEALSMSVDLFILGFFDEADYKKFLTTLSQAVKGLSINLLRQALSRPGLSISGITEFGSKGYSLAKAIDIVAEITGIRLNDPNYDLRDLYYEQPRIFSSTVYVMLRSDLEMTIAEPGDKANTSIKKPLLDFISDISGLVYQTLPEQWGKALNRFAADGSCEAYKADNISVLMSTATSEYEYLHSSILSVASQLGNNCNLIIYCDGKQTEVNSAVMIARSALACLVNSRSTPRVYAIGSGYQVGTYNARNICLGFLANYLHIDLASQYIMFHDDDDIRLPGMLLAQSSILGQTPHVMAVKTGNLRINSCTLVPDIENDGLLIGSPPVSALFRGDVFDSLGYYDNCTSRCDLEFLSRIVASYGSDAIYCLSAPWLWCKSTASSLSWKHSRLYARDISRYKRSWKKFHQTSSTPSELHLASMHFPRNYTAPLNIMAPLFDLDRFISSCWKEVIH